MHSKIVLTTLVVAVAVVAGLAGRTGAEVVGRNPVLEAHAGTLYIPFRPETSGELGAPLGGGKYVGLQAETVQLSPGQLASGYVTFTLSFDVSGMIGPGQSISWASAALHLNLFDIDFKPVDTNATANFTRLWESMELSFLRDAADLASVAGTLALDQTNYGQFRQDGDVSGLTDGVSVAYDISLAGDLGLTAADFDDIEADGEFGLQVKLLAFSERFGSTGVTVKNTAERLGSFEFHADVAGESPEVTPPVIPVPGSAILGVLGISLVGMVMRRRLARQIPDEK